MEFYNVISDDVIGGYVVTGSTSYEFALNRFVPLIGRLDIQRDPLKVKFYSRLENDIVKGCVMPPITIAIINEGNNIPNDNGTLKKYLQENVDNAFILDGIQRLNTLKRSSSREGFNKERPILFNYIIAKSRDRLLYRMITLNNGQKPMSARHQIDVLADTFFDFSDIALQLVPEKGRGRVRAPESFKKADFVKGYIAYLSGSINIDNQKIIEEKMDELIANKIIESDIVTRNAEFADIVKIINEISMDQMLKEWIRNQNTFIGFCCGIKTSYDIFKNIDINILKNSIFKFEKAFSSVNVSKVNLGKVRRECVSKFIDEYETVEPLEEFDLLDKISGWIS